jgi:hypothetical protein
VQKVYKLRHTPTGLFRGPSGFNAKGRTWGNIGHVKNHLRQQTRLRPEWRIAKLEELEIVEYEVREVATIPAKDALQ